MVEILGITYLNSYKEYIIRYAHTPGSNYILVKIKIKSGFTLAEVLVTLVVIGIVAALSIPSLLQTTNEAELKTAYKEAFARATQSWKTCAFEATLTPRTGWQDEPANQANFNVFKAKFLITKTCTTATMNECFVNDYVTATDRARHNAFIDTSGMSWSVVGLTPAKGYIGVDINGKKPPNLPGKDLFVFCTQVPGSTSYVAGCPNTYADPGVPTEISPGATQVPIVLNQ